MMPDLEDAQGMCLMNDSEGRVSADRTTGPFFSVSGFVFPAVPYFPWHLPLPVELKSYSGQSKETSVLNTTEALQHRESRLPIPRPRIG